MVGEEATRARSTCYRKSYRSVSTASGNYPTPCRKRGDEFGVLFWSGTFDREIQSFPADVLRENLSKEIDLAAKLGPASVTARSSCYYISLNNFQKK